MLEILKGITKKEPKVCTVATKITKKQNKILDDYCKRNDIKKSTLLNIKILEIVDLIEKDINKNR